MMLETFGDSYRAYVARTGRGRPVDTVKPVPTEIFKSAGKKTWDQISCHFRNIR
jgi:predicted Co/Zn/Cd cation transporter (cation efflux family)